MSFFSSFLSRKSNSKLESALSDHKAFFKKMSDENKQKFDKSWGVLIEDFQKQYCQILSKFSAKQRWNFAFGLLNEFNTNLSFDLLKDTIPDIPDIPAIHNRTLDLDIIEIMLEDIEIAKYEYGFTISELGEFSELLAKNIELSLVQSADVIKHVLEIGLTNYSSTLDELEEFLTCIDKAIKEINVE